MERLADRKGRFKVPEYWVRSSPLDLIEIQRDVAIIRADLNMMMNEVEFWGISPAFDLVEQGQMIPEYIAEITETADGVTVKWTRIQT